METSRFGASPQAIAVVVYLLLISLGCGVLLFLLLPDDPAVRSVGPRKDVMLPLSDDSARTLRIGFLSDSSHPDTLKLRISAADSVGRGISDTLSTSLNLPPCSFSVSDSLLLALVLLVAALGASLHGLLSLAAFVGNREFTESWILWYLSRPVSGALLGLVFYLVGRGGLFIEIQMGSRTSLYAVLAVAILVGLFSKQALDKLSDLFDVLFQSNKQKALKDKLNNADPAITSTDPTALTVGTIVEIVVTGKNFTKESVVRVGGEARTTNYKGPTQISFTPVEADVSKVGTLQLTVFNPGPPEKVSKAYSLKVE